MVLSSLASIAGAKQHFAIGIPILPPPPEPDFVPSFRAMNVILCQQETRSKQKLSKRTSECGYGGRHCRVMPYRLENNLEFFIEAQSVLAVLLKLRGEVEILNVISFKAGSSLLSTM